VHVIGLSILSGSHIALVREVMERLIKAGLQSVPVVVGGIIPPSDAAQLTAFGVARVYTPKDYDVTAIMADIVNLVEEAAPKAA
jgi:(2R)-ethylmalonyl-CoA mutase